jgi:hypothetical protein
MNSTLPYNNQQAFAARSLTIGPRLMARKQQTHGRFSILFVLALLLTGGWANAQTFSATGLPAAIPDPGNVAKTITVTGLPGTVTSGNDVQVSFAIGHRFSSEIIISITPPGGSEIILVNEWAENSLSGANIITISQSASGFIPIPDGSNNNGLESVGELKNSA